MTARNIGLARRLRDAAILGTVLCTISLGAQAADEGFVLFTDNEVETFLANPLPESDTGSTRSISMQKADGPVIQVAAPAGFQLSSPVDFDIRIRPKGGVPVEMRTLKVEYRIGPIWTDVTRRLAGHGSVVGTRLRALGAELPSGRHRVRLSVRDSSGRQTRAVVSFSVVN